MIAKQRGGNTGQVTLVLVYLGQALYPERFRYSQEGGQPVLVDAHLSAIHEIQKASHVHVGDIFQYDYRVLVGVANKKGLQKIRRQVGKGEKGNINTPIINNPININ